MLVAKFETLQQTLSVHGRPAIVTPTHKFPCRLSHVTEKNSVWQCEQWKPISTKSQTRLCGSFASVCFKRNSLPLAVAQKLRCERWRRSKPTPVTLMTAAFFLLMPLAAT